MPTGKHKHAAYRTSGKDMEDRGLLHGKRARKMCPLARIHLKRNAFASSCSHGTVP